MHEFRDLGLGIAAACIALAAVVFSFGQTSQRYSLLSIRTTSEGAVAVVFDHATGDVVPRPAEMPMSAKAGIRS
jgi:hypothetical protein